MLFDCRTKFYEVAQKSAYLDDIYWGFSDGTYDVGSDFVPGTKVSIFIFKHFKIIDAV